MWDSYFQEQVIRWAAAFWTDWGYFGTLYKRELQWSSLDDTKAWARISVVFVDKKFLIQEMLRRWYKTDLPIELICGPIVMVLSNITPMFLANWDGWIMPWPWQIGGRDCYRLYFSIPIPMNGITDTILFGHPSTSQGRHEIYMYMHLCIQLLALLFLAAFRCVSTLQTTRQWTVSWQKIKIKIKIQSI